MSSCGGQRAKLFAELAIENWSCRFDTSLAVLKKHYSSKYILTFSYLHYLNVSERLAAAPYCNFFYDEMQIRFSTSAEFSQTISLQVYVISHLAVLEALRKPNNSLCIFYS